MIYILETEARMATVEVDELAKRFKEAIRSGVVVLHGGLKLAAVIRENGEEVGEEVEVTSIKG